MGSKHFRVNATDTPVFKMPSRICRSIEAMKAQIYSPKNIIKMTKLEMASELLPMVIELQEKEVKIDIEVNNRDITICHWENDRIARSIGVETEDEFTKATYYLKSL